MLRIPRSAAKVKEPRSNSEGSAPLERFRIVCETAWTGTCFMRMPHREILVSGSVGPPQVKIPSSLALSRKTAAEEH